MFAGHGMPCPYENQAMARHVKGERELDCARDRGVPNLRAAIEIPAASKRV